MNQIVAKMNCCTPTIFSDDKKIFPGLHFRQQAFSYQPHLCMACCYNNKSVARLAAAIKTLSGLFQEHITDNLTAGIQAMQEQYIAKVDKSSHALNLGLCSIKVNRKRLDKQIRKSSSAIDSLAAAAVTVRL